MELAVLLLLLATLRSLLLWPLSLQSTPKVLQEQDVDAVPLPRVHKVIKKVPQVAQAAAVLQSPSEVAERRHTTSKIRRIATMRQLRVLQVLLLLRA